MAVRKQGFLRGGIFLAGALVLLALAAWLMMEPEAPKTARHELEFPRYPRSHEIDRQRQRSTFVPPQRADAGVRGSETPPAERAPPGAGLDPLHVALGAEASMLVLEASTLLSSPIGRMLLGCLSPEQARDLAEWEQKTGFKPLQQLDRIAYAGVGEQYQPVLVLSGDVRGLTPGVFSMEGELEPYGRHSRLYSEEERAVAIWNDKLALVGHVDGVKAALARLEGEEPANASPLADEAYGEAYGTISASAASRLVPSELRERLAEAAERVTLHVDATDDLLLVADVYGKDPDKLRDLATAIGGALSLGRLQALREEDTLLSDLLDESRVVPGTDSFQLEVALPLSALERQLGDCAAQAREPQP